MLSCMGISGNWRTVVRNLAVRVSWRKLRGGMPTLAHRLKVGLVRKAPVMKRTAEFWMVSRVASWEGLFMFICQFFSVFFFAINFHLSSSNIHIP